VHAGLAGTPQENLDTDAWERLTTDVAASELDREQTAVRLRQLLRTGIKDERCKKPFGQSGDWLVAHAIATPPRSQRLQGTGFAASLQAAMSVPSSLDPAQRIAGVLIPVFALRSGSDLGVGDIGGLRAFVDWAAAAGFALVQLLPINETGGDNSPYNAISSTALDPTTLELHPKALPDLSERAYRDTLRPVDLSALRAGPVQYAAVKELKQKLLRAAFRRFNARAQRGEGTARADDFARFQERSAAWLEPYTLFRALMERNGGTECWDRWPAEQQNASAARAWVAKLKSNEARALQRQRLFYAYVQWVAYSQWGALKRHAQERGVSLMGDIPLGISYYSADFFGTPQIFEPGWFGGAPPEPYFKDDPFTQKWGQNWGIPVYAWAEMQKDDYAWWRQRVHGVHDLFHVFRIDHILGFYRIYSFPWRPERNAEFLPLSADDARQLTGGKLPGFKLRDDTSPENRAANCAQGESLLRIVLDAAGETRLIGEDLGTVPDYVRPNLTALGIAGFKIPIWEPDPRTGGLLRGANYGRLSVATYGTHDHQPLRALWGELQKEGGEQQQELHKLADFASLPPEMRHAAYNNALRDRLLAALFESNSWIAVCTITDLLGSDERFNVPGTSAESNWSRRMNLTVDDLRAGAGPEFSAARFRQLVEESGRTLPRST
jgi:4-alpha-glucanotransferase